MDYLILIIVAIASFVVGRKTAKTNRFAPREVAEMDEMREEAREALAERTENRKGRILNLMDSEAVHADELQACGVADLKKGITTENVVQLLGVSAATARKYLNELENEGKIVQIGKSGKDAHYLLNT